MSEPKPRESDTTFTRMQDATRDDYAYIARQTLMFGKGNFR